MENIRSDNNFTTVRQPAKPTICPPARLNTNFVLRRNNNVAPIEYSDLRSVPANRLLASLSPDRMRRIRPFLKLVNLSKDEYLYQQDDPINYVYFPETAVISDFQIAEDGRTIEVAITGGEGGAGLTAAFNECHAVNCMQVCIAGTAWKIESEFLEREANADPEMREILLTAINAQFKNLSQKLICNTFHSVEQRFCTWLLLLKSRSPQNKFRLTHEHIARVLGVHRPSVTFIAQHLRDRKLIDYSRGSITLLDSRRLEKFACRCYLELNQPVVLAKAAV